MVTAKKEGAAPQKNTVKKVEKAVGKRTITLRLKKSLISCNPGQRATMAGLGLRRQRQERTLENTPSVRGMIKKVIHLVEIVAETR